MKTVAIVGTFDSKGKEFLYLKELFAEIGLNTLTLHTGTFEPAFVPDVSNEEIAAEAGENLRELVARKDRARATAAMAEGTEKTVLRLYQEGKFQGIISLGGSGGTSIITPAMRALPIGVPKIVVSTMASGNTEQYIGTSDVILMPSIVDVAGLNSISTKIFSNAVFAMAGMLEHEATRIEKKPLVAATMFGVTTPCIETAKSYLEEQGYEVLVFHATGTGGRTMEDLVRSGYFQGVLDLTTTEWCDELFGGVLNAGPNRSEAAGLCGVPQVVSVGACDMVNFGPIDTVPERYKHRNLYRHNPTVTLMRTTAQENKAVGEKLAEKLNLAKGESVLMLPLKGVSMIDAEGQPFHGPEENQALFDALRTNLNHSRVELCELDEHINDDSFALAAAKKLIAMMESKA
ncbi:MULTISPECIES: Tm-1-like ATP-binding domain-containing protein [Paenibacillus]|uniref:Tm-1-like ATP-binding domain-containing protein n=1 Tax=Paenibacillus TaxID=44249 RepID=UPI002FE33E92